MGDRLRRVSARDEALGQRSVEGQRRSRAWGRGGGPCGLEMRRQLGGLVARLFSSATGRGRCEWVSSGCPWRAPHPLGDPTPGFRRHSGALRTSDPGARNDLVRSCSAAQPGPMRPLGRLRWGRPRLGRPTGQDCQVESGSGAHSPGRSSRMRAPPSPCRRIPIRSTSVRPVQMVPPNRSGAGRRRDDRVDETCPSSLSRPMSRGA
jgi:hypothetical protein